MWRRKALTAAVALVTAAGTVVGIEAADAATYPNPGVVTGSVDVHDPAW